MYVCVCMCVAKRSVSVFCCRFVIELILYGCPWQGGRLVIHENSLLTFSGPLATFVGDVCLSAVKSVCSDWHTFLCMCVTEMSRTRVHPCRQTFIPTFFLILFTSSAWSSIRHAFYTLFISKIRRGECGIGNRENPVYFVVLPLLMSCRRSNCIYD